MTAGTDIYEVTGRVIKEFKEERQKVMSFGLFSTAFNCNKGKMEMGRERRLSLKEPCGTRTKP